MMFPLCAQTPVGLSEAWEHVYGVMQIVGAAGAIAAVYFAIVGAEFRGLACMSVV
jgi:hypothetical protein